MWTILRIFVFFAVAVKTEFSNERRLFLLLRFLKKYWWIGLIGSLFMVGEVLIDLIQPKMMARIVDDGILKGNEELVWSVGVRMILVVFLGGCCGILSGVFVNICSQHFGNDLRKACFERIMNFSFEQTDDFTVGSLITRTTSDVTQVQNMVAQLIRGAVRCRPGADSGTCRCREGRR